MLRLIRTTALLVALALLGGVAALGDSSGPAQTPEQPPAFRSGVDTVPLYVTVTDSSGRLVPGLVEADFEVYDEGERQAITVFRNDTVPFTASIMLDTSLSMSLLMDHVKAATEQFVIRLLPDDMARVGYFNDRIAFTGQFTSDRDSLVRSIEEVGYGNGTRLWDAIDVGLDALEPLDERRVVVVFTDGGDTTSERSRRDVLERARRSGVIVYAIGLESELIVDGRRHRTSPDRGLKGVAEESGGGFYHLKESDELGPAFTDVVQELHTQYVLGFTPRVLDGEVRKVEVKLTRPDLQARTRRSYVAPTAQTN